MNVLCTSELPCRGLATITTVELTAGFFCFYDLLLRIELNKSFSVTSMTPTAIPAAATVTVTASGPLNMNGLWTHYICMPFEVRDISFPFVNSLGLLFGCSRCLAAIWLLFGCSFFFRWLLCCRFILFYFLSTEINPDWAARINLLRQN